MHAAGAADRGGKEGGRWTRLMLERKRGLEKGKPYSRKLLPFYRYSGITVGAREVTRERARRVRKECNNLGCRDFNSGDVLVWNHDTNQAQTFVC